LRGAAGAARSRNALRSVLSRLQRWFPISVLARKQIWGSSPAC